MITQKIDEVEEFINPNINYDVMMSKIRNRILNLESDIQNVQDPVVKGFATEELIKLRKEYFDYLVVDLKLQHMMLTNPEVYNKEEKK